MPSGTRLEIAAAARLLWYRTDRPTQCGQILHICSAYRLLPSRSQDGGRYVGLVVSTECVGAVPRGWLALSSGLAMYGNETKAEALWPAPSVRL